VHPKGYQQQQRWRYFKRKYAVLNTRWRRYSILFITAALPLFFKDCLFVYFYPHYRVPLRVTDDGNGGVQSDAVARGSQVTEAHQVVLLVPWRRSHWHRW